MCLSNCLEEFAGIALNHMYDCRAGLGREGESRGISPSRKSKCSLMVSLT